jgi:hypothetical protein
MSGRMSDRSLGGAGARRAAGDRLRLAWDTRPTLQRPFWYFS